jgi:hypothetical protein
VCEAASRFIDGLEVAWDSAEPYRATAEAGRLAEPDEESLRRFCEETGDDLERAEAEVLDYIRDRAGARADKLETRLVEEPVALQLWARRPCRQEVELDISFTDLRGAEIGKEWAVYGGGSLFSDLHRAKLVYRDAEVAVLLCEREYSDRDRSERKRELVVIRFR